MSQSESDNVRYPQIPDKIKDIEFCHPWISPVRLYISIGENNPATHLIVRLLTHCPKPESRSLLRITFLPADVMDSQLSMIDLLIAMFPSPSELEIPESTQEALIKLHDWCQDPTKVPTGIPSSLSLAVYLAIATDKSIQVNISISVSQSENPGSKKSLPLSYSLRQPEWMSKAEVASIAATMPSDDVFAAFEYIRDEAMHLLQKRESLAKAIATRSTGRLSESGSIFLLYRRVGNEMIWSTMPPTILSRALCWQGNRGFSVWRDNRQISMHI